MIPEDRFLKKFIRGKPNKCWEWQGKRWSNGYGVFCLGGSTATTGAHRFAWSFVNGPIPEGLEIDHLCKNRACVNPAHLEVVTHAENMRRAIGWKKDLITHCKWGHEFTEENTGISKGRGRTERVCRTCRRETMRKRRGPAAPIKPRSCAHCSTIFTPRVPQATQCSAKCKTAAYRARKSALSAT